MFDVALKHFDTYRKQHVAALKNEAPMTWFTDGVSNLGELLGEQGVFGTATENAEWAAENAAEHPDFLKLQALQLKIAMLAGFRHDLRGQFAVESAHEPKTALDFDRHTVNEASAAQYRLRLLDQVVKVKAQGANNL